MTFRHQARRACERKGVGWPKKVAALLVRDASRSTGPGKTMWNCLCSLGSSTGTRYNTLPYNSTLDPPDYSTTYTC